MKKKLLLVLMLIAAVVIMPRVYADDAVKATVTDITNPDTLKSTPHAAELTPDENGNYTITYEEAEFELLDEGSPETSSEGREAGHAWIGFRVELPTSDAKQYEIKQGEKDLVAKKAIPEDDKIVNVYYGFDAEKLAAAAAEGKNLEATFTLNLYKEDNDETPVATQTVKIVIVPKGIIIEDEDEDNKWNEEKYEEKVKKVTVTVKVMKDGKEVTLENPLSYELPATYAIGEEELAEIKAALTDEDVELVGLYTDEALEAEFDETAELTDNVTIYVAYKTKAPVEEEKTTTEEEKAPNTVDNAVMYIALAGASLLVASGVAVYFKKANE